MDVDEDVSSICESAVSRCDCSSRGNRPIRLRKWEKRVYNLATHIMQVVYSSYLTAAKPNRTFLMLSTVQYSKQTMSPAINTNTKQYFCFVHSKRYRRDADCQSGWPAQRTGRSPKLSTFAKHRKDFYFMFIMLTVSCSAYSWTICALKLLGAHDADDLQFSIISVNKRLDDWVTEPCLDTRKVQFPRKDGTATGQNTGVTTPKRNFGTSPRTEIEGEMLNGSSVMAAALQKKMSRKRKVSILQERSQWFALEEYVFTADIRLTKIVAPSEMDKHLKCSPTSHRPNVFVVLVLVFYAFRLLNCMRYTRRHLESRPLFVCRILLFCAVHFPSTINTNWPWTTEFIRRLHRA